MQDHKPGVAVIVHGGFGIQRFDQLGIVIRTTRNTGLIFRFADRTKHIFGLRSLFGFGFGLTEANLELETSIAQLPRGAHGSFERDLLKVGKALEVTEPLIDFIVGQPAHAFGAELFDVE